ncbi:MAG: TolC family protein [Gammaproteobacteria bacterium]
MKWKRSTNLFNFIILVFFIPIICHAHLDSNLLTLSEAEQLAIANAPELQGLRATAEALRQQAIADGQLSDPKLSVGAVNVPTNTFSFTQDDMTMIMAGIEQSFPKGHSLAFKSKQTEALADAEQKKMLMQGLVLLRRIRESWIDLYYWTHAKQIIYSNQELMTYLVKSTQSRYSVGKGNQSDLLQSQVQLTKIKSQISEITQQIEVSKAQLSRWIGNREANRHLSNAFPNWSSPPSSELYQKFLCEHPLLKSDLARIEASYAEVNYAKEQFKPGFTIDAGYGVRQGRMNNGDPRTNMLTAMVTIDLPMFPSQRQNRVLRASTYRLEAAKSDREIHYRDLLEDFNTQYAKWKSLSERKMLYKNHLVPEARENAKSALRAYQSATVDIIPVLNAYMEKSNAELQQLEIEVELAKARVNLLYLEGK